MAQQDNIAAPTLGMFLDVSPISLKENQYPYALNAAIESNSQDGNVGSLQNEGSNFLSVNFPAGYKVIGRVFVHEQNRALYCLVGNDGHSQIGEILDCNYDDNKDDIQAFIPGCADCIYTAEMERTPLEQTTQTPYCTYYPIIVADCFDFNINNPVRMRYKITDCGLNIYFTDNLNQRSFLYFDYIGSDSKAHLVINKRFKVVTGFVDDDCKEPIYSEALDCNKIKYHPSFETPCIESMDIVTGGSLKAGVVQALIAYSDFDGNPLTEYFPATNPVSIFTKQITFETNYQTDKAVKITLTNIDQTFLYQYYNIVIAETIDDFTEFKLIGTYPVTQVSVLYTGNEINFKKLTEDDVFYRKAYYNTAGNITDANRFLFFSNLKEFSKPNLQRVALDIKLFWQTVAVPEALYYNSENSFKFRGFPRDEVFPFGVEFITAQGEVLGSYHIPGPNKSVFTDQGIDVDEPITNNDVIQNRDCTVLVNCCGSDAEVTGTIATSCSDAGCTEQGSTTLIFTFDTPLAKPLKLHIGQIVQFPFAGDEKQANGFDLFTIPPGVNPRSYYLHPNEPFEVIIPQGVTAYTVNPQIHILGSQTPSADTWICHDCQSPIIDLYIKPVSDTDNITTTFTTEQSYTVHNIPNLVAEEDDDCAECGSQKRWQVYNTGFVTGTPHEVLNHCDENKVWEYGEFSYWESALKYPNDPLVWGDYCGKPILYHKMPDSLVTHIHDSKNGSKGFSDKNIIFPLGIRVDHQSVIVALDTAVTNGIISQADRDRISSYRIIRGNRSGNKSIVAKGLLFDMWHYDKNEKRYYYANYPYNDLRDDDFISNDPDTYQGGNNSNPIPNVFDPTGRYTFHSPDIHFVNPTIGTEVKLEALEYGQSEGYFNFCELQAKQRFLSTASMTLAFAAGVAIAFSTEKEKECKVVVSKSMQAITGTVPGAILTIPAIPGVNYLPLIASDPTGALLYDDFSGQPIIPTPDPLVVTEVQRTTCHGKPFQLLSPISGNPVGLFLQQAFYLLLIGLREMKIIIDLIRSLVPLNNFSIQYNSIGKYVNYQDILNAGNKIREIKRSAYLEPAVQLVNEAIDTASTQFTNIYINNWYRERSVYLKTDDTIKFPNPAVADTSRFTMDAFGLDYGDLNRRVNAPVSSYYASIKNYIPDQYGDVNNIQYLPTGDCDFKLVDDYTVGQTMVFGGDTFISRFALKRKMPFFLQTRFRANNEADARYSDLGNVGFPNYYFNTEEALMERLTGNTVSDNIFDLVVDLLGVANTRLDAKTQKAFYQNGYIHLYNYGIPYFFAESDVNVDYRHGENNLEKDFYPHQQDLDFWLQEKNVPITEDNYYFYNKTYSKQNKEAFIQPQVKQIVEDCQLEHPSLVIGSIEQTSNDHRFDNWLIFRANDAIEFPTSDGRVIGLDGIENGKLMARFENNAKIFAFYDTLQTDAGLVKIGKGDIFSSNPREFSTATLGFAGSQHTDLIQTEFGHIWADSKRGQIFSLAPNATGLDELGKDGFKNWFKENLPFQILKDFPNFELEDIDNNFKGIGLHLSFDKRFSRFFITKLDYKKVGNVTYNAVQKKFFDDTIEIALSDKAYFCDKSWTISYSFITKTWTSFYSFKPNFYLDNIDYFQSGLNDTQSSLWSHNVSNKSYQVFYGKLYPFTVETISTPLTLNGILNSVEYITDVLRFHNNYDYVHNRRITFNKALIFNEHQCSLPLQLIVRDENKLTEAIQYPKVEDNVLKILVTNRDNRWNFNQFWDAINTQSSNLPILLNKCNNAEKVLNTNALNFFKPDLYKQKIRGKQIRLQLTNDADSNHKFIYHLSKQEKGIY